MVIFKANSITKKKIKETINLYFNSYGIKIIIMKVKLILIKETNNNIKKRM